MDNNVRDNEFSVRDPMTSNISVIFYINIKIIDF